MSRTITLFTAVVLALSALTSAAPVDSSSSLASPVVNAVASSNNITLEKREKHQHHKKSTQKKRSSKKSSKRKTTKKTTTKKTTKKTTTKKTTTKKTTTKKTTTKKTTTKKTTTKKTTTKKTTSSSSGSSYTGTGTWFIPSTEGGSAGACGPDESDTAMIVALNAPQYGNMNKKSSWCGKKISIKGPKGTATAIINDACPECKTGSLDMTQPLFEKVVGDLNKGVGTITWHLV